LFGHTAHFLDRKIHGGGTGNVQSTDGGEDDAKLPPASEVAEAFQDGNLEDGGGDDAKLPAVSEAAAAEAIQDSNLDSSLPVRVASTSLGSSRLRAQT
jgi:hypothetical protein